MRLVKSTLLTTCLLFAAACGSKYNGKNGAGNALPDSSAMAELPVPIIPDSLVTPDERAAYIVCHYWDAMDFTDPVMAGDSALVEQSFSNFIALLPYADPNSRQRAVSTLLDHAANGATNAYNLIMSTAEHYLWDPESPYCSEELYLPFVDYALTRNKEDIIYADRRDVIMKNCPGSLAPDFKIRDRDGDSISLRNHDAGVTTLLMFYEPDCDRCHAAIEAMEAYPGLNNAIAAGTLRVLAVYIGDNTDAWTKHASTLPRTWQVAIDCKSAIDHDELYTIRATPSFYLIDPSDTIILKDSPLSQILSALN